jgi:integrase
MKKAKKGGEDKVTPEDLTVKVGSITARIYPANVGTRKAWLVRYYVGGEPKTVRAPTLEAARSKARQALKTISTGAAHVRPLTLKESANVDAAISKLQPLGVSLLEAVAEFVAARQLLPKEWSLGDAVRGFKTYKERESKETAPPEPMKFRKAVEKFHERNEKLGLSEGYRNDCRKHLAIIGKTFDEAIIQSLRQPELTACLEASTGGGARRFNNLRGTLCALFGFCQKKGILPLDRKHEAALIDKKVERHAESIAIYTPKEMRVILANIGEELLPWALLGGFAGLRVSEVHRLRWENIRLDAGFITLDKSFTKTRRRRVIPICDALRAWIEPLSKDKSGANKSGLIYPTPYKTYEDRLHKGWMKMADAKGQLLVEKRANALRHSYGTYRFSILQDEFKVSAEMGNSPTELRASYAELALPKDAEAWFAIMPEEPKNIVKIPKQRQRRSPKAPKGRKGSKAA